MKTASSSRFLKRPEPAFLWFRKFSWKPEPAVLRYFWNNQNQKFSDADSENFKESEPPVISKIEISNDTEFFFKKGYSQNQTQPEALRYPFRFITPVQTTNQNWQRETH